MTPSSYRAFLTPAEEVSGDLNPNEKAWTDDEATGTYSIAELKVLQALRNGITLAQVNRYVERFSEKCRRAAGKLTSSRQSALVCRVQRILRVIFRILFCF